MAHLRLSEVTETWVKDTGPNGVLVRYFVTTKNHIYRVVNKQFASAKVLRIDKKYGTLNWLGGRFARYDLDPTVRKWLVEVAHRQEGVPK